ncbi:MAG TPA: alpha/beta hydrolase [Devosia sp.]
MTQQRFKTSDGVEIVYDDLGSGTPVVLCHGLAAAGEQLLADAEYFAERGYRVLVPDLRGHGRSGKPARLDRESLSIGRLATDLLEMLDHAAVGPVHWVGNSLGGIVALWMLPAHEARLRTLATFGTSYRLSLPGFWARGLPLVHDLIGKKLIGWGTALTTTKNVAARPLIEKLVAGFDPHVGAPLTENLAGYDLIANAVAASLPILMLRGGEDRAVNAALGPTLAAMQGRPNFALVEVPTGGHCANLDATDDVRRELEGFWGRPR